MIETIRQKLSAIGGMKAVLGLFAIGWGLQMLAQTTDERGEALDRQAELLLKQERAIAENELRLQTARAAADIAEDRLADARMAAEGRNTEVPGID